MERGTQQSCRYVPLCSQNLLNTEWKKSWYKVSIIFWMQALKESVNDIRGTLEGSSIKVSLLLSSESRYLRSLSLFLITSIWMKTIISDQQHWRCFKTVSKCTCSTSNRVSGQWWLCWILMNDNQINIDIDIDIQQGLRSVMILLNIHDNHFDIVGTYNHRWKQWLIL